MDAPITVSAIGRRDQSCRLPDEDAIADAADRLQRLVNVGYLHENDQSRRSMQRDHRACPTTLRCMRMRKDAGSKSIREATEIKKLISLDLSNIANGSAAAQPRQ